MSRKFKKIVGVVLSLTMIMAMSLSVFAAPSSTGNGVVTKATATTASGKTVEVTFTAPSKTIDITAAKTVLGNAFVEGMEVVDVKDVDIKGIENLTSADFPITITFTVPNVVPTTKVAVLHFDVEKQVWESVDCKAGNGTITATFNSLSPVAFLVDKNTAAKTTTTAKTGASPKTGESSVMVVLGAVAVLAVLGAGYSFKKREVR